MIVAIRSLWSTTARKRSASSPKPEKDRRSVLVATSGETALNICNKVTPDTILMDAIMPGLDGFETCRQIKENPALQHVPVIFMTGLSETEHVVKALESGGVDFLTKPIDVDELKARIKGASENAGRFKARMWRWMQPVAIWWPCLRRGQCCGRHRRSTTCWQRQGLPKPVFSGWPCTGGLAGHVQLLRLASIDVQPTYV